MSDARLTHWQNVWTVKTPDAVGWFQAEPAPSLAMIEAAGIPPATPVVDVGGGASSLVDRLLKDGFTDLTVLDVSESALAHARARLAEAASRVTWIAADVTEWRPARRYGVWHDRAVFHFLAEETDRLAYRRTIEAALEPGGWAIIATFAPDGPERCSGLPVMRHDGASLSALLGPAFTLVEERREEHHTPSGGAQKFTWCLFRKV